MGGRTYRDILCMDVFWPYKNKATYIITRNPLPIKDKIHLVTECVVETIFKLKQEEGKDIWLVGDGELITMLLNEDLVDNNLYPSHTW